MVLSRVLFFLIYLFVNAKLTAEPLKLKVNAEGAILMNAETGAILYEKNSRKLYYPASITKIATALYALKLKGSHLDEVLTVEQDDVATVTEEARRKSNYSLPSYWLTNDGTHIGLKKGEKMPLRDLLYGMMLVSGNDAGNVIARYAGGTIPNFMSGLNAYFKEINCQNTTFYNPHGLFHPKHQTTAYDMALITREALKNPVFCQIVSTVRYTRPKTNKQEPSVFVQSNKLLRSGNFYYPKAIGVKTGYLISSENTFVAAARHENRTLIAVLLKTKERNDMFQDAIKMFEEAFKQPKLERTLLKEGPQKFTMNIEGTSEPIKTYLKKDITMAYYAAEDPKCKCYLYWEELKLPIAKDEQVGELRIQNQDGVVLLTAPLFAQEDVNASWSYWFTHMFQHLWSVYPMITMIIIAFIILLILKFIHSRYCR